MSYVWVAGKVGRFKSICTHLLSVLGLIVLIGQTSSPASAAEVSFGSQELFDFGTFAEETRYGWTSGDTLISPMNFDTTIGTITGSKNKVVIPAVKAWGVTVIPEVRADTRSGARLTSSLDGRAGVQLNAGVTVGGEGFNAMLQAGPTLSTPDPVVAGQYFRLNGSAAVGSASTFDPGLPRFDAGMDVVLDGTFQNKFEYGLYPLAGYSVGEFGFDFDLGFNLFDINIDLNLPKIPLPNLPEFPDFNIPESERDNTAFRQKLPPANPALNLAEIAIDNPFYSINTTSGVEDGKLTYNAKGSLLRTGLDIDGITSALATGVSFTGTSVPIGPGKLSYDTIDVKYGIELGIEYESMIDPVLTAQLTFDNPVMLKDENGDEQIVTEYTGRWDELPEFALLNREDVNVDVDFTNLEAILEHSAALTLSDYMELQALKLSVKVGPVKLVDLGPAYYQKFPLAGEFADFELFTKDFSLGSIDLSSGFFADLWDGMFTIEALPIKEVYLNSVTSDYDVLSELTELSTGLAPTTLPDKTLVIATASGPVAGLPDLAPVDYVDAGNERSVTVNGLYMTGPFTFAQYLGTFDAPDIVTKTKLDGLIVPEGSTYTLEAGAVRQFDVNFVTNDGQITGQGYLGFESSAGQLTFSGNGVTRFTSPGRIAATTVNNLEGHTIFFDDGDSTVKLIEGVPNFTWISGPSANISAYNSYLDGEPLATRHSMTVGSFNNFGTLRFEGQYSSTTFAFDQFDNYETGRVEVAGGSDVTFTDNSGGSLYNTGMFQTSGSGTNLYVDFGIIRSHKFDGPGGAVVAENGGKVHFTNQFLTTFNQRYEVMDGSEIIFEGATRTFFNNEFIIHEGGTMRFEGTLTNKDNDGLNFVNYGTLEILADVSLRPFPDIVLGGDPPTLNFIDLLNEGTINVRNGAEFEVDAIIDNFTNDGATLVGGTWNVIGADGTFSNLDTSFGAITEIDFRVLDVAPSDEYLFEVYTDLSTVDTALKTNAANVSINGVGRFLYFNTVETNEGNFTISGGHQFTTATGYTNRGGTTNVQTGADLFVQGALRVIGGSVNIDSDSTFTAQTQTEVIDDDGNTEDRTVEVLGGTLDVADSGFLAGTPMFFDRASADPRFIGLEAGQVWVVRESVAIDLDTEEEIVTPAAINLGDAIIERNNGTIIIDGSAASFDAAEAMQYNHGTLQIENGFEFNTRLNDFRNAGDMTLLAATFIVTGEDGTFRNDGDLYMDGESLLQATHFINDLGATLHLDGVLDAHMVTITAGTSITGSGSITGEVVNNGLFSLGDSPGLVETYSSYTQGAGATSRYEIEGDEAGVTYDQLIVHQVVAPEGQPPAPDVIVTLAGLLELVFAEDLPVHQNFDWLLIDNEGETVGMFDEVVATGLDPTDNPDGILLESRNPQDLLLGALGEWGVYLTYFGGDGNDVVVYTTPEPSIVLTMLALLSTMTARKRRRR